MRSIREYAEETSCPRCGGSRVLEVAYTQHDHATRGGYHGPMGVPAPPHPANDCCCPGSPLWRYLEGSHSPRERAALARAAKHYAKTGEILVPRGDGRLVTMAPVDWRTYLRECWEEPVERATPARALNASRACSECGGERVAVGIRRPGGPRLAPGVVDIAELDPRTACTCEGSAVWHHLLWSAGPRERPALLQHLAGLTPEARREYAVGNWGAS